MQQTTLFFKQSTSQFNSSRPSSSQNQNGTSQKVASPIGFSQTNSKNDMRRDLNTKVNDGQHNTSETNEHKPSAPPIDSNASIVIISASNSKEISNNGLLNEEQISLIQNSCSNDISNDNDAVDKMSDTITEKLKNLTFKKPCQCMSNCINNHCTCRKANVKCTNECHKGSNCANK